MKTSVARKLGINPGMRALIIAPPPGYLKLLASDGVTVSWRAGMYPFVQVFATSLSEVSKFAEKLPEHAAPNALVWLSYPKKTSKARVDINRDVIRGNECRRMACRLDRCYRRSLVSIALPASTPSRDTLEARYRLRPVPRPNASLHSGTREYRGILVVLNWLLVSRT